MIRIKKRMVHSLGTTVLRDRTVDVAAIGIKAYMNGISLDVSTHLIDIIIDELCEVHIIVPIKILHAFDPVKARIDDPVSVELRRIVAIRPIDCKAHQISAHVRGAEETPCGVGVPPITGHFIRRVLEGDEQTFGLIVGVARFNREFHRPGRAEINHILEPCRRTAKRRRADCKRTIGRPLRRSTGRIGVRIPARHEIPSRMVAKVNPDAPRPQL